MKKILIIAYYYPPFNNGGTQRIVNFKKYLPQFGYSVDICTTDALEENDDVGVYRIKDLEYRLIEYSPAVISLLTRAFVKSLVWLGIQGGYTFLWKKSVLRNLPKKTDMKQYDYILATYPKEVDLEIGYKLSKKYKIPLIIDYRDGYTYEPFYSVRMSYLSMKRAFWFEKKLSNQAKLQIAVNQIIGDYLRDRYRVKTIDLMNGFDDEEIFENTSFQFPDGFNIVYTGSIELSRRVYRFGNITDIICSNKNVNFVFIGKYTEYEKKELKKCNNAYVYEAMDRKHIIPIQRNADMLLLITGDNPSGMTGKIFEYIFAGKPILNLGSDNIGQHILDETNTGRTFKPSDFQSISQYINDVKEGKHKLIPCNLERYTRKEQCRELAMTLDGLR